MYAYLQDRESNLRMPLVSRLFLDMNVAFKPLLVPALGNDVNLLTCE
jgi:hypothetical protein